MSRFALTAAVFVVLPAFGSAQVGSPGIASFGGGPSSPGLAAGVGTRPGFPSSLPGVAFSPVRGGFRGRGFAGYGGFAPYGFGGGFVTGGGFYSPYYYVPGPGYYDYYGPAPRPVAPGPPPRIVYLSGEDTAVLTLEFPAPAELWLDGKPVAGDAAAVRSVTSPVLPFGGKYTFKVRARWSAGGKTYEYEREVTLANGDRSRVSVLSGTLVEGK